MPRGQSVASQIDVYVKRRNPALQPVVSELRSFVKKHAPQVTETINAWGIPTFELNGPMGYFMVGKNHVTFGFARGTSLSDPEELLEGTGKNLRQVKLRSATDLEHKGLRELVRNAGRLNRGDPAPRVRERGR